jgi:hypothetical protein
MTDKNNCTTSFWISQLSALTTSHAWWSKAMLAEECGEDIRPFLRMIFANSKDMFERISKLFERHQ